MSENRSGSYAQSSPSCRQALVAIAESILVTIFWWGLGAGIHTSPGLSILSIFLAPLVALVVVIAVLSVLTVAIRRKAKLPQLYGFLAAILVGFMAYLAWAAYVSDYCSHSFRRC
jgi:hypothetical protein